MDKLDEKIIFELKRNARLPLTDLAKIVGLSRNAVRQRIERLEHQKIIKSYTIEIGGPSSEAAKIAALIFVYRADRMRGGDVIDALKKIPEIQSCDIMSGEFDIVARVEAQSTDRIRAIWENIAGLPGVRDTVTAFVLSPIS